MSGSIQLDEQHGLNPSLEECFYCGEPKGVVLFGKLKPKTMKAFADAGIGRGTEAPHKVVLDYEPCDKCKGVLEQGIMLIGVDEELTTDRKNPYRTGKICVITEESASRLFQPEEVRDQVLEKRMAYIPKDVWEMLGIDELAKEEA